MVVESAHVIAVRARLRDVEIGDPGWRLYRSGACRILAGECPDAPAPRAIGDHAHFAYLTVDDVDRFHDRIAGRAEIVKEIRTSPGACANSGCAPSTGTRP